MSTLSYTYRSQLMMHTSKAPQFCWYNFWEIWITLILPVYLIICEYTFLRFYFHSQKLILAKNVTLR